MVTDEQFAAACSDYKKAKALEDQAEAFRKAARQIILDYEDAHAGMAGVFEPAPDSESGKTVQCQTPDGLTARITHPTKKGQPSRFDMSRTAEAYRVLEDALPAAAQELFRLNPEFLGPDVLLSWSKANPGNAGILASIFVPFTLPATEDTPLAPRVEVK